MSRPTAQSGTTPAFMTDWFNMVRQSQIDAGTWVPERDDRPLADRPAAEYVRVPGPEYYQPTMRELMQRIEQERREDERRERELEAARRQRGLDHMRAAQASVPCCGRPGCWCEDHSGAVQCRHYVVEAHHHEEHDHHHHCNHNHHPVVVEMSAEAYDELMFSVPFTTSYVYTTTPASIVTATPIITPVVTQTPVYIPVLVQEKPAEKKPDPPKKDPPPPPPPKPLPQPEYHSHNVTHIQISTNSSGFHTTHTSDVTPLRNDSGHTMFYHNGKDTKSIPPGGLIPHWTLKEGSFTWPVEHTALL
ncbi:hypothetical protein DFH27DRAFT_611693 [Peziza echinospora]|nr:hypothetical protein DFH27DRAFT_611693 [Peziza echinospora]